MKKILFTLLALSLLIAGASAAVYTDDLGRNIKLPDTIERVVPSGNLSQMIIYSVTPERIAGWSSKLSAKAAAYFDQDVVNKPVFGTFYGKAANLNKEALMAAMPDVVIDMGEIKGSVAAMTGDLDKLQADIVTPVIFIEAYLDNTPDVYRKLGLLFEDSSELCEELATFAEDALNMAANARSLITDPVTVYYSSSSDGLEGIEEGNFHGEVIEKVGGKNVLSGGLGASGRVSMEELYMLDPDVILLSSEEAYENALTDPMWSLLSAVENGRVYLIPTEPYSFIDSPPATNRIIGIYWLGNLLYPELYPVDIVEKTIEYYKIYYRASINESEAERILGL